MKARHQALLSFKESSPASFKDCRVGRERRLECEFSRGPQPCRTSLAVAFPLARISSWNLGDLTPEVVRQPAPQQPRRLPGMQVSLCSRTALGARAALPYRCGRSARRRLRVESPMPAPSPRSLHAEQGSGSGCRFLRLSRAGAQAAAPLPQAAAPFQRLSKARAHSAPLPQAA
jgi:hypothetical protein